MILKKWKYEHMVFRPSDFHAMQLQFLIDFIE